MSDQLVDEDGSLSAGGITINGPGLAGRATLLSEAPDLLTPGARLFHAALGNSGLSSTRHVALTHATQATADVQISVPAPKAGFNSLLLVHDSTGALTWHRRDDITTALPAVQVPANPASTTGNGSAPTVSFTVPASRFSAGHKHIGLLARIAGLAEHFHFHPSIAGASKLISVLEYPIEHLVGTAGSDWFQRWENNKHPAVIRWFPPEKPSLVGEPLSPTNWHELAQGPTLLFIHGIFSNCESGFEAIDDATWGELRSRYDNRIIGFDHPTGSVAPDDNARWFLSQIPNVHLDLDIVCHSRGGLVARSLADQAALLTQPNGPRVTIKRIVFAATPNGGSQITVTKNWVALINRLSSVLTLPAKVLPAPAGAITEVLAGLLEVIKIVGVGVALDLKGLMSMTPGSAFLQGLGQTGFPPPEYFAAASDFEPGPLLANLFNKLNDEERVVDSEIFDGVPNDIAVPTEGVWNPTNPNGLPNPPRGTVIPGFPISDDPGHRLRITGSVFWHCGYFDDPAMRTALLTWLPKR